MRAAPPSADDTGAAAASPGMPVLERATAALSSEFGQADLLLGSDTVALRHALEVLPMLWQQYPCALVAPLLACPVLWPLLFEPVPHAMQGAARRHQRQAANVHRKR